MKQIRISKTISIITEKTLPRSRKDTLFSLPIPRQTKLLSILFVKTLRTVIGSNKYEIFSIRRVSFYLHKALAAEKGPLGRALEALTDYFLLLLSCRVRT